jgi:type III restriction enzyme
VRYQLKDYQDDAARAVLERLEQCREDYHRRGERFSFALSATTGAGKTVIAATVIEALIHGSTEFDVEADPGAVVLWISKDPALNEQTRHRIIEAADRVPVGDLVLLDKDFAGEKLEKGTVYFINPAKLASSSLFVRKTNARQFTFWEILDNTIRDDQLTLYVILDEAHEGMKAVRRDEAEERQTIVQKIINGNGTNLPVPIVWGISATPERFTTAMASATERTAKSNVVIDPVRVQASGLLKNTLVLDIPDEKGDFETSMLRDGTIEFVAQSARWADYCAAEGEDVVTPLLVVQLPNKETGAAGEKAEDRLIATTLNVIRGAFPEFTDDCVAHVLGDRGDLEINGIPIPKVKPQDIQNDPTVRVLLAKDAVSTGWDCPRAEVLVSLRPARDKTYITQLLGRMVRTPLARSTNDDRLNSASCFLPHFDRPTAKAVSEEIMGIAKSRGGEPPLPPGPKVIFQPVDLAWNEKVPEEVRELLESLPSLPKPAAAPRPVKRAIDAATAMAVDGFVDKPNEQLMSSLFGVLDGAAAQYAEDVEQISAAIMEAEVRRFTARHGDSSAQTSHMVREADENTVKEALGSTRRILGAAVVTGYLKKLYQQALTADGITADLVSIDARVAALSRIERNGEAVVVKALQDTAETQTRAWLGEVPRPDQAPGRCPASGLRRHPGPGPRTGAHSHRVADQPAGRGRDRRGGEAAPLPQARPGRRRWAVAVGPQVHQLGEGRPRPGARPVLGRGLVPQPLRRRQALHPGALPQGRALEVAATGLHLLRHQRRRADRPLDRRPPQRQLHRSAGAPRGAGQVRRGARRGLRQDRRDRRGARQDPAFVGSEGPRGPSGDPGGREGRQVRGRPLQRTAVPRLLT